MSPARVSKPRGIHCRSSLTLSSVRRRFKCCLSFYQVWAVRKSVYGFELPGDLSSVMAFFEALSFDVGTFIFPSWTCIGGLTTRLWFSGLWPHVLIGTVVVVLLGIEAVRKGSFQRALMRSLAVSVFVSFCVLPSVTRSLFLAFQCDVFGYDDSATPPESKSYLSAALNVECYDYLQPSSTTADHVPILVTAWIFIVLWPVAMPLLYAVLLFRCRHAIRKHQPSALSRATRFLWGEYTDRYFWFEMYELCQKLVLTNALLCLPM